MNKPCQINEHDIDNPEKVGRAHWNCRKCGHDISFLVFLAWQAGYYYEFKGEEGKK